MTWAATGEHSVHRRGERLARCGYEVTGVDASAAVLCHGVLMYYADPSPVLHLIARRPG